MGKSNKPKGYWTKERVFEESKKYSCRNEFSIKSNGAYSVAWKNKWLDEMTWFKSFSKPKGYWTYERCKEVALKFTSKKRFEEQECGAYNAALRRGWIKDFNWFKDYKTRNGDPVDCVYVYKFESLKAIYVGRTIDRKRRDADHRSSRFNDAVYRFSIENFVEIPEMEIIEDHLTIQQGSEREGYWVEYYKTEGWTIINISKSGAVGSCAAGFWTKERCKEIAKTCISKKEFELVNRYACAKSRSRGWLREFFPEDYKPQCKKIDKLDLDGNYIETFNSIREAAKSLSTVPNVIARVLKNKRATAKGFKWRYHDPNNLNSDNENKTDQEKE